MVKTDEFKGHAAMQSKSGNAGMPTVTVALLLTVLAATFYLDLSVSMQTVRLNLGSSLIQNELRITVISDLHIEQSEDAYHHTAALLRDVLEVDPDLILILGDLTASPTGLEKPSVHRTSVASLLSVLPSSKTALVLGNYESWDSRDAWRSELEDTGIVVLENDVSTLETSAGPVCVRGLGDFYSGNYQETSFPPECEHLSKLTITHDPAAAFQPGVEGLIFAGHTHCGQVSLPLIGPLWAPTKAPREAWCGLYQDELRTLWVSSGVGTSILPVRLGTRSEWDLIEIFP